MNVPHCPPRGPGRNSSVGEWMYLTVCPSRGPDHDSSVGESMYLTVCPPCGPGTMPIRGGVFQGIYSWLITLCQPALGQRGRKWLNLPSMAPHNLRKSRTKAENESASMLHLIVSLLFLFWPGIRTRGAHMWPCHEPCPAMNPGSHHWDHSALTLRFFSIPALRHESLNAHTRPDEKMGKLGHRWDNILQ